MRPPDLTAVGRDRDAVRRERLGLVDWLLACPGKGYFVAVEPESTDTPPRARPPDPPG